MLFGLACLAAGCGGGKTAVPLPPSLSLFVTGGLNMQLEPCSCKERLGGHERRVTIFNRFISKHPQVPVLYLDAGLAFKLDSSEAPLAVPFMKEAFRALKLDAFSPGSYELTLGVEVAQDSLEGAGFPLTSANLRNIDDGKPLLPPYVLLKPRLGAGGTAPGPRVGVIGVTMIGRYTVMNARNGGKAHLIDPLRAVAEYLPEVSRQSEVVVVMGHFGHGLARQLSELHPEIDLIVATDTSVLEVARESAAHAPIYFTGLLGRHQLRLDFLPNSTAVSRAASGPEPGAGAQRRWSIVGNVTAIGDSVAADPDGRNLMVRYRTVQDAAGHGRGVSIRKKPS